MMMRWLILLLSLVPSLATAVPAAAQDRVVIGTQLSAKNAALFLAAARGYFKAEGLEVDMRNFPDNTQLLNTLASGQIDLATSELSAFALNMAGKGSIKLIAAQARENPDFEGNQAVASVPAYNRGLLSMN
jgi:NitT/TauT family transport system substrate-binding protein